MLINGDHTLSVTECGIVTTMSKHAILLIPFYYIPVVLLLVLVAVKLRKKLKLHYKPRLALSLFSIHIASYMYVLFLKQPCIHNHFS